MAAMQHSKVVRGGRRRHALQDARRGLQQRHLQALAGRHRGGFQADVASADDQQPLAGDEVRRQRIGVSQAAHHENALQRAAAIHRQTPRPRAGEQHQPVVRNALAVFEHDAARLALDALHALAEKQRGVLLLVPGLGADQDLRRGE